MMSNVSEEVRKAKEYAQCFFRLPLSLGERMLLRQQVAQTAEEIESLPITGGGPFAPAEEGLARHLCRFYGYRDMYKLVNTIMGIVYEDAVREIKEKMSQYD